MEPKNAVRVFESSVRSIYYPVRHFMALLGPNMETLG